MNTLLDQYIVFFFLYAVLGYISEVLYCSIPQKHFVNRGFLHGPYLPIYGFGALFVVQALTTFQKHPVLVFILALLGTSLLEYITSFALEKIFHMRLWDYSKHRFQVRGRVCLLNATLFGAMGLVVVYAIQPMFEKIMVHIPAFMLNPVAKVLLILLAADTTSSVLSMAAFHKQMLEFRLKSKEIEKRIRMLAEQKPTVSLQTLSAHFEQELDELKLRMNKTSRRILEAFPSLTAANEERRLQLELLKMNLHDYHQMLRERGKHVRDDLHDLKYKGGK